MDFLLVVKVYHGQSGTAHKDLLSVMEKGGVCITTYGKVTILLYYSFLLFPFISKR